LKKLRALYRWILISVILQTAVLAYANFVYIPGRGSFRATIFEMNAMAVKNRKYKLPEGASEVKVSFDGLYAAYRLGDILEIVDMDSKKTTKRLKPSGGTLSYYRWLPDRDMLIYSIKEPEGKSGRVRISTFDIGPELDRSYPDIKNLPEGSAVIDIELSPLTNIVYPMIQSSESRVRIYKFDIMDNLNLIMKADLGMIIGETMYSDHLIYQPVGAKIKIRNGRNAKTSTLAFKKADLLLSVDDFDFIYAASTDEAGKLTEIHNGKIDNKADEWKTITLENPTAKEDVFITPGGRVYLADRQTKTITDLKSNLSVSYQGQLLTVIESYVVSINDGDLLLKVISQKS